MEIRPPESRLGTRVVVIAVVVAVLIATVVVEGSLLKSPGPTGPPIKDDGPTFYQALAVANRSMTDLPGGPWTLYAVWGIATVIPLSPNSIPWPNINQTVNSCGLLFNGLTLWNGSIPLFNGTFDSGTAPFWQFAFYSNASQSIEIATDVLGVARAYTPMLMSSACAQASGLWFEPWTWAKILAPFPADSTSFARSAWNLFGSKWSSANPSSYEAYVFGFSYWGSANPSGLVVKFSRCGLEGAAGVQPVAYVFGDSNGSSSSYFNGSQGCGNVLTFGPPVVYIPYILNFSAPGSSTFGGTAQLNLTIEVPRSAYNTTGPDPGGLTAWMTGLNLSTSTGENLPTGSPVCPVWVGSLASCGANSSGWYVVLTSSSGEWLDTYGSTGHVPGWLIPNVAFVTKQHLVVVTPSSWDLAGGALDMRSTASNVSVDGSGVL